jgi:hypothetical protein
MKRLIISPGVLFFLTLTGIVVVILLVPPVRIFFGNLIWDRFIIPFYEQSGIFRYRLLIYAILVFCIAAFVFSRSIWWRYVTNAISIEFMERTLQHSFPAGIYQKWRHLRTLWYPKTRFRVLNLIPKFQTNKFQKIMHPPGYLMPNRRYLAILRARLDFYSDQMVISLMEQRYKNDFSTQQSLIEQIAEDLHKERYRWYEHHMVDRPAHCRVPEPVFSSAMLAIEHWTLACAYQCILGRPFPHQEDLEVETESRLSAISSLDESIKVFGSLTRQNFYTANHLNADPSQMFDLLTIYRCLCTEAVRLGETPEGTWARGLAHRLTTLTMERLVALGYYYEAIQVYYHSQMYIGAPEKTTVSVGTEATPVRHKWKFPKIKLYQDVPPSDESWNILASSPFKDNWQQALLVEAWGSVTSGLLRALPYKRGELEGSDRKVASIYEGERLSRTRMWAVRRGYLTYASDEAVAATNASLTQVKFEHLIRRKILRKCITDT